MNQYQSESIDQLITALAKAQGEMADASKDRQGYNYKYADLAGVWGACRGALSHNGLAVSQVETQNETGDVLITILAHSSGQWIRSIMPIRVKPNGKMNELQERGAVLTYLRRYALSAIVGVAPAEDDDGASAHSYQASPQNNQQGQKNAQQNAPVTPKIITQDQANDFRALISKCSPEFKRNVDNLLKERNINGFHEMGEVLYKNLASKAIEDMKNFQASNTKEEPIAI
jgi:hypothetical protein